jgi:hypothetical protein
MIRTLLAASMALALMAGVAVAQSSSTTTSTQSSTSVPTPVIGGSSSSSTQQTTDCNGVVTNKSQTYTSGNTVAPAGNLVTSKKTTVSTTVP